MSVVERRIMHGMQEVIGSTPLFSTTKIKASSNGGFFVGGDGQ
jgi:hypothetical protein